MPGQKRKGLIPRRRRHDDDGDDDGSVAGDAASTVGSSVTDADDDANVSVVSADDEAQSLTPSPILTKAVSQSEQTFKTTADTEAMLNGLKANKEDVDIVHFNDTAAESQPKQERRPRSQPTESAKQRNHPQSASRGGYFLHDERHRQQAQQGPYRGRGRGADLASRRGNVGLQQHETNRQWTHDLHETINQPAQPAPQPRPASVATAPNRSFSTTTVLGKVPVTVSIPGIEKIASATMVKKHYTLLPQHRPPLRRDKPVRISIPDEHPRYIFPSTDRSFIFIPRAMRPNQQPKGRGRGSFHGSRRTSMYSYTPSIGMSRRPSIAASNPGSGIHTPTGPPIYSMQKPVVRMPVPPFMPSYNTEVFLGDNSAIIHSPPVTLPMHQPIPQKSISVNDIESPATAPQQQFQQPFHQQVPNIPEQPKMPHIPEGAIYAQPFQPYPMMPYGAPFQPGMYPSPMSWGGPVIHPGEQTSVVHETNGMVYYYDPHQQYGPPMVQPNYYYPPMPAQMFYQ